MYTLTKEEKLNSYAQTFLLASIGVLALSVAHTFIGFKTVQKAQAFNLIADGHRALSLAKTYDAKAAALSIKTVMEEVLV